MTERVGALFASRGLDYNPNPEVVPNSMRALQLTELARDLGRHAEVHDHLMDAYWSEGRNIGDEAVLRGLAAELVLPADEVEDVLAGDRYRDRVEGSTRQALAIGANAVPAFLLDRRLLVLGAQPEELFEQAFTQLEESA
jgi:predicted DsbA family dithiol-disulfide isomerase